ncbi:putative FBD domain-containing protein [Helianthus annuus]|nr:putative FBD domain-containing protein [Helianthus annuus]
MEDMPSLVEASVVFGQTKVDRWVEFLKRITGIKSLSIEYAPYTSPLPVFPKLSHLELPSFCLIFLESSPELKHLCFGMSTNCHWDEPKSVPECMVTTLTSVKVLNCNGQKCNIQLLEYLLGNAEVLKRVTITWGYMCSKTEEQMQLAAQLLKVPRASRHCEIHFLRK